MPSFDIVSEVNLQEVDNALNQTRKEVEQRYDFKGSKSSLDRDKQELKITSDNEDKLAAVIDILQTKLVKRGVSLKSLKYGKIDAASGGLVRQVITLQHGIDADHAKQITKLIKESKMKVQAQIQADQVRISGKKRDDLQEAMQLLRGHETDLPFQFVNFRD